MRRLFTLLPPLLLAMAVGTAGRDLASESDSLIGDLQPEQKSISETVGTVDDFARFTKQGCDCSCDCQEGEDNCDCECACPDDSLVAAVGKAVVGAPPGMFPSGLQQFQKDESGPDKLRVIWLMSFPNSGTSFTLHLIRESTNHTTGTNYALEGDIKDKPSEQILPSPEGDEGPFLELVPNRVTTVPQKYILTKTHCHGFCGSRQCPNYIHTARSFQMGCRSGFRAIKNEETGRMEQVRTTYDADLVKGAIHLFRYVSTSMQRRTVIVLLRKAFHLSLTIPVSTLDIRLTTQWLVIIWN
jgi:hypothetical protein